MQGKNVPTIVVEEAPKKIDEGLELTVRKLEEALRVQAEEMVQLKLQLGITTKLFEQCKAFRKRLFLRDQPMNVFEPFVMVKSWR